MPKTCLIVSDDSANRKKLREALDKLGLNTLEAASVERAKPCIKAGIDAILVEDHYRQGLGNLLGVLNDFPQPRDNPIKVICLEGSNPSGGGSEKSHFVMLMDAANENTLGDYLSRLGILP